jgi:hypothetical protein
LRAEQQASLSRPPLRYTFSARLFFAIFDLLTGKADTLPKARLLETLASIPYREWEIRQYARITRLFRNIEAVNWAERVIEWGRDAQDNEYDHLQVIHEKMKEDSIPEPWYLAGPLVFLMVLSWRAISRLLALLNPRRAFLFNAEFEDHAEHVYAGVVLAHPEWETQPVSSPLVQAYCNAESWSDVFRRIGLDERDHMNNSFLFYGSPERIVHYKGMPTSYLPQ